MHSLTLTNLFRLRTKVIQIFHLKLVIITRQHHHEHNVSCDDRPISLDLKNHQVAILVFLNEWLLLTKFPTIPPHKLIRPPERLRF